jgi:hypothetical protein
MKRNVLYNNFIGRGGGWDSSRNNYVVPPTAEISL